MWSKWLKVRKQVQVNRCVGKNAAVPIASSVYCFLAPFILLQHIELVKVQEFELGVLCVMVWQSHKLNHNG